MGGHAVPEPGERRGIEGVRAGIGSLARLFYRVRKHVAIAMLDPSGRRRVAQSSPTPRWRVPIYWQFSIVTGIAGLMPMSWTFGGIGPAMPVTMENCNK